ncbi:MAG: hypothetical protein JXA25_09630 [Anaerolineales bacterium]|nr:hypothetical protein [Anaerolineales bacterium]
MFKERNGRYKYAPSRRSEATKEKAAACKETSVSKGAPERIKGSQGKGTPDGKNQEDFTLGDF